MTGAGEGAAVTPAGKADPETLALRGRPRPAIRFRKGLVIGVTAGVCVLVTGLAWFALDPPTFKFVAESRAGMTDKPSVPEAVAGAPEGYGDVPRLGAPLPGDLGRPILARQRTMLESGALAEDGGAALQRLQQRASEEQAALASPVLARTSGPAVGVGNGMRPTGSDAPPAAPANEPGSAGTSPAISSSPSLSAGTIIPASLLTGLNSDLPGPVVAQVTEEVRDSASGRSVIIPQGARLIGDYSNETRLGQQRLLIAWHQIQFPDGTSVSIEQAAATDASGYAGLHDRVDSHPWQLMKGIALATLLGVSGELSIGGESDLARAVRESVQGNASRSGEQLVSRHLDVKPTLTVRPGWRVRAILTTGLALRPWN